MEEILHHLGCIKPCKECDKLPNSTGKRQISSINSMTGSLGFYFHLSPPPTNQLYTWMSRDRKLGSMVNGSVGYNLNIPLLYVGRL